MCSAGEYIRYYPPCDEMDSATTQRDAAPVLAFFYTSAYADGFPLPLVESSLPHPLLTVERAFASSANNKKRDLIAQKDNSFGLSQTRDGRRNLIIV